MLTGDLGLMFLGELNLGAAAILVQLKITIRPKSTTVKNG